MHLLAYVTRSVSIANLIFMSAYIVLTPLGGFAFARATGRSPWLALLLLPLAVSIYFQWGFIAFCCGVMLMLPAMAALYRLLDAPTLRGAVAVGLWTAALYLFQIVPWARVRRSMRSCSWGSSFRAVAGAVRSTRPRRWRRRS